MTERDRLVADWLNLPLGQMGATRRCGPQVPSAIRAATLQKIASISFGRCRRRPLGCQPCSPPGSRRRRVPLLSAFLPECYESASTSFEAELNREPEPETDQTDARAHTGRSLGSAF